MLELHLIYASISEEMLELNLLKEAGWSMRFSDDGQEIIARKSV